MRPGAWYAAAVNALAASGLLTGYSDGSFRPNKPITRAELAAILAKLRGETPEELAPFYDIRTHWAREGISLAYAKGWVSGYPDGSFRPNNRVTRAEAAVMLTKFLDRRPDLAAIAAGEGLRFFPDVKTGSWYYNAVMEAATDHSAHFETPEADEQWLNPKPSPYSLKDGFYCFGRNLFAAEGGSFVRSAGSRTLNGVSYSCAGDSGVCSARTEVLRLASGELILLHGGRPLAAPGGYADGFWLKAGQLYASVDGHILRKATQGSFQGVAYTCTGESGVCTVADWRPLALEGVSLSVFDAQLTPEAAASGSGTATVLETLRAAVRVYERYFQVEYPLESKTDQDWINKALEYGILVNRRSDYDQPVKRGDAAVFLQRALRGRELEAINEIADIPDVSKNSFYYPYLMCLYNAGVMQGVGTQHKADIYNTLPRSELAKLLTRLERRTERLRFTIKKKTIESIQYGTRANIP